MGFVEVKEGGVWRKYAVDFENVQDIRQKSQMEKQLRGKDEDQYGYKQVTWNGRKYRCHREACPTTAFFKEVRKHQEEIKQRFRDLVKQGIPKSLINLHEPGLLEQFEHDSNRLDSII